MFFIILFFYRNKAIAAKDYQERSPKPNYSKLLKPRQGDKRRGKGIAILLKNTSAFDSLVHSFANMYVSSANIRTEIDGINANDAKTEFFRFVTVFVEEGASHVVYRWRTDILYLISPRTQSNGIKVVECSGNINVLLDEFIVDFRPMLTTTTKSCEKKCSPEKVKTIRYFEADCNGGIQQLQQAIEDKLSTEFGTGKKRCPKCGQERAHGYELHKFIFVCVFLSKPVLGSEIPGEIRLKDRVYKLKSTIDERSKDHYVANCIQNDGKWHLYDTNESGVIDSLEKRSPLVLFYVQET